MSYLDHMIKQLHNIRWELDEEIAAREKDGGVSEEAIDNLRKAKGFVFVAAHRLEHYRPDMAKMLEKG